LAIPKFSTFAALLKRYQFILGCKKAKRNALINKVCFAFFAHLAPLNQKAQAGGSKVIYLLSN
jgi:hypothetical protein